MKFAGSVALTLVLLMTACTNGGSDSSGPATTAEDLGESIDADATTTAEVCEPERLPITLTEAPATDVAGMIALSESGYNCMASAVVVLGVDDDAVRLASETAISDEVPLLRVDSIADVAAVQSELDRLEVENVISVGLPPAIVGEFTASVTDLPIPTTTTTAPPTTTTTTVVEETADGESTTTVVETTTTTTVAESSETTAVAGDGEESTTTAAPVPTTTIPPFDPPAAASTGEGPLVLYRLGAVTEAYLALPALRAGGGDVAVADISDVDATRDVVAGRETVLLAGEATPTEQWQVALAASDTELFGGGTRVFPDRRIVAYYGNPLTFRLGLLGETDPDRAVERVTERAALYNAEGLPPALPGFEIIATVAATQAGDDGNYSNEMDIEVIRPWIDAAMANDVSVILDLQPGRTDFLTQAKIYEEFLRLPNVGLALDPEWRLKPDQRHLRQIGGVSAEEVNAVIDYLAGLVHEETLPQKTLILHQFQERMLPDRQLIKTPPEVAVVVHVDGQGSLGSKYGTWAAMRELPTSPDQQLWWAWKNFIDEDFPTATPGQVNAVEPLPVIVTYQ